MFFKLFKQDRGAAAATVHPATEVGPESTGQGDARAQARTVDGGAEGLAPGQDKAAETLATTAGGETPASAASAGADTAGGASEAAPVARPLEAANSNVATETAANVAGGASASGTSASGTGSTLASITVLDAGRERHATAHAARGAAVSPSAAFAEFDFATTADLEALDGPIGQEQALADLARAAAVSGPGFHIAVVAANDLLAGEAIRDVIARFAPRAAAADWVYVHNFADASAPVALALPPGSGAIFADAVHGAVTEALAGLDAGWRSDERAALRRGIDAQTRGAHDDRLNSIKSRAEAQNLAVLRTPNGFVVAPVHEGKVVKPEVFARLPEAMRADVEARVTLMQDELAAALAERPRVERERRQRLVEADLQLARGIADAAFAEVSAAFGGDSAVARHLTALRDDLIVQSLERAEAVDERPALLPRTQYGLPRRARVNVFALAEPQPEAATGARIVAVSGQATSAALAGHARRGDRENGRGADHLDLAPGAAHRAEGGVLLVDAARLLRFPDGITVLEHMLATGAVAIEDAAPALTPEPIPLSARVVLLGDREALDQLARVAPGLLARLSGTANFALVTARSTASELSLARRMAAAVTRHGLLAFDDKAVAALVDLSVRMAGDAGQLSCRLAPLIDVAREADVLARRDGRDTVTHGDVTTASEARQRSLGTLGGIGAWLGANSVANGGVSASISP